MLGEGAYNMLGVCGIVKIDFVRISWYTVCRCVVFTSICNEIVRRK